MDWKSPQLIRAGIIPVLLEDKGSLNGNYIFGVDAHYNTLIDLGGHREVYDYDVLDTALRELREESLGTIDWSRADVLNSDYKVIGPQIPYHEDDTESRTEILRSSGIYSSNYRELG